MPDRPWRTLLVMGCVAAFLTGCGAGNEAAKAAQCRLFAEDVRVANLAGDPTPEQVSASATRLDSRVNRVGDPAAHEAAVLVHDHMHRLQAAMEEPAYVAGDRSTIPAIVDLLENDVQAAARACGLPTTDFLGPA